MRFPRPLLLLALLLSLFAAPTWHAAHAGKFGGGDGRDRPVTDSDNGQFPNGEFQVTPDTEDEPVTQQPKERYQVRDARNLKVFLKQAKVIQTEFPIGNLKSVDQAICTVEALVTLGYTVNTANADSAAGQAAAYPPRHFMIAGLTHGVTQVTVWPRSPNRSPLTFRVEVVSDPAVLRTMEQLIRETYEESEVTLRRAGDTDRDCQGYGGTSWTRNGSRDATTNLVDGGGLGNSDGN